MTRIYGYARVSTMKQSIERQIANILKAYPDAVVIQEAFTGTKMDRPKWNSLERQLKSGDTLVFDEVSRMSRNAEEGFQVYKELYERGVNLIFLKESTLNTENFRRTAQISMTGIDFTDAIIKGVNEALMILAENQIKSAFETAQQEVSYLHQRTKEGIEAKEKRRLQELAEKGYTDLRPNGIQKGTKLTTKKSIKSKELILKHSKDFQGTLSDMECMKLIGLARNTYYKYKNELREAQ